MQNYQEFKTLLEGMKTKLTDSVLQLEKEMNLISSEGEIDDAVDMASIVNDAKDHSALIKQQKDELADVNYALAKFELGGYGICEKTGAQIPLARLKVEPQARCVVDTE